MKTTLLFSLFFVVSLAALSAAETNSFAVREDRLQRRVEEAVHAALTEFTARKLQSNQVAVTLVELRGEAPPQFGSFRGDVPIYPASIIKLFYLAAAHRWMAEGKLRETDELRRALRDMIVDSSNDATHYTLDSLTETMSGPELPEAEMKLWGEKRNAVNRFFASLGYEKINVNQKPWCEGPYGRDRVWVGKDYGNRNALTTDATARLLAEIAQRRFISAARCEAMLELLKRDPGNQKDSQARFTVTELMPGAKLFSKAGWTSTTRHDAAYLEFPDGKNVVLVTFTTGQANAPEIVRFIGKKILSSF